MHLSDLKHLPISELVEMAIANEIDGASRLRKQDLIFFAMLKNQAKKGESIFGDGTLEVLPDGFGFLRSPILRIWPALTISTSAPRKSVALTCIPATPLMAKSVRPKTANVILRW